MDYTGKNEEGYKHQKESERILNSFIVKIQIAFKINRKEAIKLLIKYYGETKDRK